MKLNFWQILGVLLVVIAVVLIVRREASRRKGPVPNVPATTVAPATVPH
jgi:hypothetical protein